MVSKLALMFFTFCMFHCFHGDSLCPLEHHGLTQLMNKLTNQRDILPGDDRVERLLRRGSLVEIVLREQVK